MLNVPSTSSTMARPCFLTAMVDEVLGMLNMPTEQEINTVQARFQELRRELRTLRSEVEAGRVARQPSKPSLKSAKRAQTAAPAARKAAVKKKVASRTSGAAGRRQKQS